MVQNVSDRTETQAMLFTPLHTQRLSHLDHARSHLLPIPRICVLEPLTMQSRQAVLAGAPCVVLGLRNPFLNFSGSSLRLFHSVTTLVSPSLSMFAVLLTPVAVLAGALGVWRLG